MLFGVLGVLTIPLMFPAIASGALAIASCSDAGTRTAARAARILGIVAVVGGFAWGILALYYFFGMLVIGFSGEDPPYGIWNWWEAFAR